MYHMIIHVTVLVKRVHAFRVFLFKKNIIQWYETRIEYMVVKIASVIEKSPYKLLDILIIFIDNSYIKNRVDRLWNSNCS